MIFSLYEAVDDNIETPEFWTMQSWIALLVWTRLIMTNLGDIEAMSWLIGLIQNSTEATALFMAVLICAVTAFSDSFNALDQKIMIKGSRYDDLEVAQQEKL
mmetsp:Transcript_6175/g.7387  ORF Transcript_6175/g.7387 Transcript_6175/m.7387 type:complete len:102 (+) Transcript_6175:181-486(+)